MIKYLIHFDFLGKKLSLLTYIELDSNLDFEALGASNIIKFIYVTIYT